MDIEDFMCNKNINKENVYIIGCVLICKVCFSKLLTQLTRDWFLEICTCSNYQGSCIVDFNLLESSEEDSDSSFFNKDVYVLKWLELNRYIVTTEYDKEFILIKPLGKYVKENSFLVCRLDHTTLEGNFSEKKNSA